MVGVTRITRIETKTDDGRLRMEDGADVNFQNLYRRSSGASYIDFAEVF